MGCPRRHSAMDRAGEGVQLEASKRQERSRQQAGSHDNRRHDDQAQAESVRRRDYRDDKGKSLHAVYVRPLRVHRQADIRPEPVRHHPQTHHRGGHQQDERPHA